MYNYEECKHGNPLGGCSDCDVEREEKVPWSERKNVRIKKDYLEKLIECYKFVLEANEKYFEDNLDNADLPITLNEILEHESYHIVELSNGISIDAIDYSSSSGIIFLDGLEVETGDYLKLEGFMYNDSPEDIVFCVDGERVTVPRSDYEGSV